MPRFDLVNNLIKTTISIKILYLHDRTYEYLVVLVLDQIAIFNSNIVRNTQQLQPAAKNNV